MKLTAKLWIGIGILALLSPLGLLLPERFKAGSAWGEWSADDMRTLTGYVPGGLKKLSSLWNAPLPDYALKGWEEKGMPHLSFAYILSAALGIVTIVIAVLFIGRILVKKDK